MVPQKHKTLLISSFLKEDFRGAKGILDTRGYAGTRGIIKLNEKFK